MFVVFFILISLCSRRGYQPPSTQCLYLFFNLIPLCRGLGTDIYSSYIIELISKLWFCCLGPLVVVFPKLGCRVPKAWLSCSQHLVVVFPKLGCRVPKAWLSCSQSLVVVFPKFGCRVPKAWLSCSQRLTLFDFPIFSFFRVPKEGYARNMCVLN
jgi:hypothetical protein